MNKSTKAVIDDPKKFFDELGGLHDACIENFSWNIQEKSLNVSIDDLNSNFLDLPEYQGCQPADVIFVGLSAIDIQIAGDIFRIYEIDFADIDGMYQVKVSCAPSGYIKFKCKTVELRQRSPDEAQRNPG